MHKVATAAVCVSESTCCESTDNELVLMVRVKTHGKETAKSLCRPEHNHITEDMPLQFPANYSVY